MKKVIITFLVLIISSFLVNAGTINIPYDYSSIQAGLNAADSSDTVLVQPGTYYENIFWPETNGIKLISAGDSNNTIIDGGENSSVIYINPISSNIDSTTLIKGFKITNGGNVNMGGGFFISGASPKLSHLNISGNTAYNGGGIYLDNTNSNIFSTVITNNAAINYGGGIHNRGNPLIRDVTFMDNWAYYGGGIYLYGGGSITNITVNNNIAAGRGGGIYLHGSSPISNVRLINNTSHERGGGIEICGSPTISNIIVIGNIISSQNTASGGGIYIDGNPIIIYLTLIENSSNNVGDGIYINGGFPNISYSNIVNNDIGIYNNDNSKIISATYNWWGDPSGPYHLTQNPNGLGDAVNAFVNVTPWLTEPDTDAPPILVQNLHISSIGNDFIELSWDPSPLGDLSGYKICYKTDTTEFFYTDTIDVGNVTSYSLAGLSAGLTYYITAICYDTDGNESWYSTEVCASIPVVGIHPDSRGLPSEYSLSQNYPNPFNTTTTISFQLPKSLLVKLSIFDINGRLVEMLVNEYKNAGYYSVKWEAEKVGSGIYFYRINAGEFSSVKKCLVVK